MNKLLARLIELSVPGLRSQRRTRYSVPPKMYDKRRTAELLELHEGNRRFVYEDTLGVPTIGVGFNLEDEGLYPEEIQFILDNRIEKYAREAQQAFPSFRFLGSTRQTVIIDMLYNLGLTRLTKFKKMWSYIDRRDYEKAATEMLDSKWAKQVGNRSKRLARMMETGEWPEEL